MAFEQITIAGNVGLSEVKQTKAGQRYVRIAVAVNTRIGEEPNWYSVELYGALAASPDEVVARYTKGRAVIASGRPKIHLYLKKDGTPALDRTIIAHGFPELVDRRPPDSHGH